MKAFKGPAKQRGFIGLFGSAAPIIGQALGGLGGLFGARSAQKALNQGRSDILNLPGMQGAGSIGGNFGTSSGGQFTFNPQFLGAQNALAANTGLLGGGLFNDPGLQSALGANNIAGALSQSDAALQQQIGGSAFGGLGGLFSNAAGLANQFGGALSGTGFADTQASELANLRNAAQPEQNRLFNKLQDRLFATGQLGSTGGGEQLRGLAEAFGQQDLNFQTEAFNRALNQRGQQLGAFQGLSQLGAGIEGQAFNQGLQGLQQNQAAGMNRLNQAMGLLSGGADLFGQQFGLGLQSAGGLLDFGNFGLNAAALPQQLQAQLLGASGQHARALGEIATPRAEAGGGLFSGIGNALGGIFSDERLKENLHKIGSTGAINWYTWTWNDEAKRVGASQIHPVGVIAQEVQEILPEAVTPDPESGYLMVNYEVLINGR